MSVGQRHIARDIKDIKLLGAPVGTQAPDFEAVAVDGKTVKLSDFRGKVVFIDFWATWCAPCVAEIPNVKKAYEAHADAGLVVIGISFDRDVKMVKSFAKRKDMPWIQIVAKDADKSELARSYGVAGIPATFLIGPDGKVVAKDLRGAALVKRIRKEMKKLKDVDKMAAQEADARDK